MHGTAPHANLSIGPRRRQLYNLLAWLCFGLGFIGMAVPLMPTTVFWIGAAWLWLRSHPQRVRWLVDHPHVGASIRSFLERGEICRTGKTAAIAGMTGSYLIWFALIRPGWVAALVVATILGAVALWIATRPHRQRTPPAQGVAVTLDLRTRTPVRPAPPAPPPD